MIVSELIEFLKTQPQDLMVAICIYSEHVLLDAKDIGVMECCPPRPDGWVHSKRKDKPTQLYLMFPGN